MIVHCTVQILTTDDEIRFPWMSTGWTIAGFFWKAPPTARVEERTKFLAPAPWRPKADDDAATTDRIARDVLIFMVVVVVVFRKFNYLIL